MKSLNGIPVIGLGTYPLKGDEAYRAIRTAIDLGYRHIDTAQMYLNEAEVGRAIKNCGIPRSDFFVTTKIDPSNNTSERNGPSVLQSLENLGGPVDLLLIHWPPAKTEINAAVDRLILEKQKGHTRNIGVSNFTPNMLRNAQSRTNGAIICNQVEFHPLLDQAALLAEAKLQNVTLTAFCPLARGAALKHPVIAAIATKLGLPPSEVVLRWIMQQNVIPIPMTTKPENAASNLNAQNFELSAQDMVAISALGNRSGRVVNTNWMAGRWDE